MSIYGEGLYLDEAGVPAVPSERSLEQLKLGDWEIRSQEGAP
jgi:hypothetical protein